MGCQGVVILGNNLTFSICTHDPDTGVLTDADFEPTYRIYEDETEAAILTGSMSKLDDGNTVGFYTELIACTSGNDFEEGKSYTIYIEATVDSDTGGIAFGFTVYSKSGYALASDGLDSISAAEPTAKPTTFAGWIMWLVQGSRRADLTASALTVKKEDGTVITTQTVSDDGTTQRLGAPS